MNARIVRQIVGDGLIAVAQIARAIWRVHHLHRRGVTLLRRPVLRREWQRVLDVGNVLLEHRELPALLFVAHQHRRAVRGLHAEEIVEIGLVRGVDDVELRILQGDPQQIAGVVVVGQERLRPGAKERRERCIAAVGRRVAQMRRRGDEPVLEFDVIRHGAQLQRIAAHQLYDRALGVDRVFLIRMCFDVRLDLVAGDAFREERAAGRHRLGADEGAVLVELIEAAAVDPEIASRRALRRKGMIRGDVQRVVLAPVDVLEIAAGGDQLRDEVPLARTHPLHRERHLDRLEAREALFDVRRDRAGKGGGEKKGEQSFLHGRGIVSEG